ncbi:MAG TPA: TIGR02996 domain-containing protein [Gemmataceae bacterium]|nr:TIGR02996 domain-containing protein [Gemmataceae bacterium]
MSRSESDALLAAVLADPDDDAPRLVYADWLDEHARHERAALIRLQVEHARLPAYDPRRQVLARQANRLLDLYRDAWVAELPRLPGITWGAFERGFVATVMAESYTRFRRAEDEIGDAAPVDSLELHNSGVSSQFERARSHPRLRALRVRNLYLAGRLDAFFDLPLLSTLRTLELTGLEFESEGAAALARSEVLGNLRELILNENYVGVQGMAALAGARSLQNLTRLSVRGMRGGSYSDDPTVRAEGVEHLAGSHVFQHLTTLDLSGNEIDDDAIGHLLRSPHLVNLKELNLAGNDLSDVGLEALAEEGWEMRLESLDLSGNPIGDFGARHLAAAEVLGELAALNLSRCEVGHVGAMALARSEWYGGLRLLHVDDNSVGPLGAGDIAAYGTSLRELRLRNNDLEVEGARRLAGAPALCGLIVLDVSQNVIAADGVRALAESMHLRRLAILDIGHNRFPSFADQTEAAIGALARFAPGLVCLRLDGNDLRAPGVLALAQAGEWSALVELGLRDCGVNVPALAYLADHAMFPALTRLDLAANVVDPIGLKALLRAPFTGQLTHIDLSENKLGNDGAKVLADGALPRLCWLALDRNGIGTIGFSALARALKLPRLKTVRYSGNGSGDWWRQVRDRFPGTEIWENNPGNDDVPF